MSEYEKVPGTMNIRVKQTRKGPMVHPDDLMQALKAAIDNHDIVTFAKDPDNGVVSVFLQNGISTESRMKALWSDCDEWGTAPNVEEAMQYAFGVPWHEEFMRAT